jgi:hypothetical protein
MPNIVDLLGKLDKRTLAREIGSVHDDARSQYRVSRTTVRDYDEFIALIGDYFNYHYCKCFRAVRVDRHVAIARAREVIENAYRRRHGDFWTAFSDASEGTNGGVGAVLDAIADSLKEEHEREYVAGVLVEYIPSTSFERRVDMVRQFFRYCGHELPASVRLDQPERYARYLERMILAYVKGRSEVLERLEEA